MAKLKMSSAQITDGQETHVVLGAPPQDPVKVHGRVTHAGTPFTGAMVLFIAEGKNVLSSMKTAQIASDGSYAVTIDGPGKFAVTVQKLGGKPGEQSSVEFRETIPAEKDFELDLEMPTARISGLVRDSDGAPIDGATVMMQTEGGITTGSMFGGHHTTSTDGNGASISMRSARCHVVSAGAVLAAAQRRGSSRAQPVSVHGDRRRMAQDVDMRSGPRLGDRDRRRRRRNGRGRGRVRATSTVSSSTSSR
jgi:hypothetical protein